MFRIVCGQKGARAGGDLLVCCEEFKHAADTNLLDDGGEQLFDSHHHRRHCRRHDGWHQQSCRGAREHQRTHPTPPFLPLVRRKAVSASGETEVLAPRYGSHPDRGMTQEDQTVDGVGRVASFHRFRCLQVKQAVAIDNARRRRGCPGSFYAVKHSVLPFVLAYQRARRSQRRARRRSATRPMPRRLPGGMPGNLDGQCLARPSPECTSRRFFKRVLGCRFCSWRRMCPRNRF